MIVCNRNNALLLCLFFIGIILRSLNLRDRPISYDEGLTFITAQKPLSQVFAISEVDVHPPLWALIEWAFLNVWTDPNPWLIRIPALVASALTVYVFVKLCRQVMVPEQVILISTGLLALLPTQIWYGQDGRMYAFVQLLVVIATYAITARRYILSIIPLVALPYTINLGFVYWASLYVVVLVWRPRDIIRVSIAMLAALCAYGWWTPTLISQLREVWGAYWIPPLTSSLLLTTLVELFWASSNAMPVPTFASLYDGFCNSAMSKDLFIFLGAATISLITLGTKRLVRTNEPFRVLVAGMAFLPIALIVGVSLGKQNVLLTRPLLATAPFLYLTVAWAMSQNGGPLFERRLCQVIGVCTSFVGFFFSYPVIFSYHKQSVPLDEVRRILEIRSVDGDAVYHTDDASFVALFSKHSHHHYRMPLCPGEIESRPLPLGDLTDSMRRALGAIIQDIDGVSEQRVWVIAISHGAHARCHTERIAHIRKSSREIIPILTEPTLSIEILLLERSAGGSWGLAPHMNITSNGPAHLRD